MTELQMGLIGLGCAAVVGVVAYNKWQEYRHRKLAEQVLNAQHVDILLDESGSPQAGEGAVNREPEFDFHAGRDESDTSAERSPSLPVADEPSMSASTSAERIEPVLRLDPEPREPAVSSQPLMVTKPDSLPPPVPERAAVIREETQESRDIPQPLHLLSPAIDYLASFEAVEPAPAYQILEAQRQVLSRIRKPIHWIGFNEYAREWEPIVDDGSSEYRCVQVGLQLVDRQGPVSDGDLSVFHIAMQDLADQMMAIIDLPPRQPALEAAARLDEFCASVDIQIGINVISTGQVFAGTKLRALAEAAGMEIDAEGRFVRRDDDGNVLFVLLNQEAAGFSTESMKTMTTQGVTFLLDVPRVSHGERVFNQMVELGKRFADVLHGALVDDNRRPLSEGALEPIRRQVGQFQSMMAAQKLPAGSALTRRLFS